MVGPGEALEIQSCVTGCVTQCVLVGRPEHCRGSCAVPDPTASGCYGTVYGVQLHGPAGQQGEANAIRMAIIAITTRNSISVKPDFREPIFINRPPRKTSKIQADIASNTDAPQTMTTSDMNQHICANLQMRWPHID